MITPTVPLAIVRITGMYAAVALLAIGAAYATAAFHGIRDTRAGEASLIAVVVLGSLWAYALIRVLRSPEGKSVHNERHTQDAR
jgi:purine-cytosine permease-like protein